MFSKESILKQLCAMHAPKDKPVIVHISLKAVGQVENMAQGLLDAFIEYFTADGGLLIVPTHTWANFDQKKQVVLDMCDNSTCVGVFPTVALNDGRGVRTDNPTHSVVVFGDKQRVKEFIKGDCLTNTPTSPNGVYGKIFEQDGYILLVGVGQEKNTCIHCVDEMLNLPSRLSLKPTFMKVRRLDGTVKEREFYYMISDIIYDVSLFFPKYQPAFDYHGVVVHGSIGGAKTQLCSAKKMKNVITKIYNRSNGIEIMADDTPLKKEWYV